MPVRLSEGEFGIDLAQVGEPYDNRFFILWLRLGTAVLGNGQPEMVWTDLQGLRNIEPMSDPRFDPLRSSVKRIARLTTSNRFNDRCLMTMGETFDHLRSCGYRYERFAVLLYGQERLDHAVVIPLEYYLAVVEEAIEHHRIATGLTA
jgi:hypothetical protein